MRIRRASTQYMAYREYLGKSVRTVGFIIQNFAKYVEEDLDLMEVSRETCTGYLNAKGIKDGVVTAYWFNLYTALNGFFEWAIVRGHMNFNPLPKDKPHEPDDFTPYIYSNEELKRIFSTALIYRKRFNIEYPEVIQTMLKLTYFLGLRPGETVRLTVQDIDLQEQVVYIRETKFYKSRVLPFSDSIADMARKYLQWRSEIVMRQGFLNEHLFLDKRGSYVKLSALQQAFRLIRDRANIHRSEDPSYDVRLQDLRHTFATHRVTQWYKEGKDVQNLLPVLSTYLGHSNLDSTAVYITFTNTLLNEASKRFQTYIES